MNSSVLATNDYVKVRVTREATNRSAVPEQTWLVNALRAGGRVKVRLRPGHDVPISLPRWHVAAPGLLHMKTARKEWDIRIGPHNYNFRLMED